MDGEQSLSPSGPVTHGLWVLESATDVLWGSFFPVLKLSVVCCYGVPQEGGGGADGR